MNDMSRFYFETLPLCVLATWAIVECWWHGKFFGPARAWLEALPPRWGTELLLCPFCLSHWVSLGVVTFMEFATWKGLGPERMGGWFAVAGLIVLKAFAVTRLANLANDCFAH